MGGKLPSIWIRVLIYLAIIALLMFWPRGANGPHNNDLLPTVEEPPGSASSGSEAPISLAAAYPQVTLYWWSRRTEADGSQTIRVFVNFLSNIEQLEWKDLKLRGPRGDERDLASASGPRGEPRPQRGRSSVAFRLPAGQPPFEEGRVYCWIKDLCPLPAGRKLTPAQYEKALKETGSASGHDEPAPKEKNGGAQPAELAPAKKTAR